MIMKKTFLVRVAILFLTLSTLSGCILVPMDDGRRGGGYQGGDRGGHHGEHHDDSGDRR